MPQRDRSTTDWNPVISPHPRTYLNGTYMWNFNDFPNYALPKHTSWLRDVVGRPGQNNPVNHVVVDLHAAGYPTMVVASNGNTYKFTPEGVLFVPHANGPPRIESWPWIPNVSAATLSNWSIEAFDKFQTQVPAEMSLGNSLMELKQIKGLIPSIDRKSLSKTVSGNFLGFEFGVKPMISDIKAILALSDTVDKRIQHLKAMNGRSSDLTFRRDEAHEEPYSFFISNNNQSLNDFTDCEGPGWKVIQGLVFRRERYSYTFRVGGKLFQDLQGLDDANAKLKGLVAASGFNRPGTIIWNAIPYSFVVDWFFSIGKLIDSLAIQPFGGTYNVSDVMWSLKSDAHYTVWSQFTSGAGGAFTAPVQLIGTARVKIFERYTGFPAYNVFLTDGGLTPMQQVLGLAMLNQRRR